MLLAVLLLRILSRQAANAMALVALFETTAMMAMHHAKTALDARTPDDDDDDDSDQNQFFNTTRARSQRIGVHDHPLLYNVWTSPRVTLQRSRDVQVPIVPSEPSAQLIRPPR